MYTIFRSLLTLVVLSLLTVPTRGNPLPASNANDLREFIERFTADRESVAHVYDNPLSPAQEERFRRFYEQWQKQLGTLDFVALNEDEKIDYLLLQNHLHHALRQLDLRRKQRKEMTPLIPFADAILSLDDSRRRMEPPHPASAAASLQQLTKEIGALEQAIKAGLSNSDAPARNSTSSSIQPLHGSKTVSKRAVAAVKRLRETN